MSTHQTNPSADQSMSGLLASGILIVTFVVILGIMMGNTRPATQSQAVTPVSEVAIVPTTTPLPSATPAPPTATAQPTATPAPSNTPLPTPTLAPTALMASPTPAEVAQLPSSASAAYDPALVAEGQALYVLCAACHGPDARGMPNLGKDLVESEFVAAQTDEALVQFIITGRPIWDPLNTTGVDMPGKGGNPAMTTEDVVAIVAYLRTLAAEGG